MPGAWLVLPTFNEAENIEPIIRAALPQLASSGLPHRILVVDDNSPDGTGSIADRLASEIDEVEVLHRERKEGIGPAYLAGFDARARRGRRPAARDGLRLLPRPRRPAAADRGGARTPTSCSARATCPAAA